METGKTDRRVQYTKRALTSALIDLMRENHISKISVKALCAAADVNRSTFYAHFRNQYDLLAYIEAEALEDLKARLLADGEPRTRNVEKILEYAKENADVFLMLLDESEGGFQRQIMELAHLDCARWLLLTIPNGYEAGEIVASAREKCPNIEIIARAHYDDEVDYIIDRGANQVVMGEREIARAMLRLLETPPAGEVVTG